MNKKNLISATMVALLAAFLTFGIALAHTMVTAGNYEIEVGWTDEPPVVGQRNTVIVNVSDTTDTEKEVDISKLMVNVSYGGQTKALTLQPLSEDAKNQYIAPILPMIPGQYTVQLRGQIGADNIDVNLDVQPEEVVASDAIAFPNTVPTQQNSSLNWSEWLAIVGIISGLAGLILAFLAFRKNS